MLPLLMGISVAYAQKHIVVRSGESLQDALSLASRLRDDVVVHVMQDYAPPTAQLYVHGWNSPRRNYLITIIPEDTTQRLALPPLYLDNGARLRIVYSVLTGSVRMSFPADFSRDVGALIAPVQVFANNADFQMEDVILESQIGWGVVSLNSNIGITGLVANGFLLGRPLIATFTADNTETTDRILIESSEFRQNLSGAIRVRGYLDEPVDISNVVFDGNVGRGGADVDGNTINLSMINIEFNQSSSTAMDAITYTGSAAVGTRVSNVDIQNFTVTQTKGEDAQFLVSHTEGNVIHLGMGVILGAVNYAPIIKIDGNSSELSKIDTEDISYYPSAEAPTPLYDIYYVIDSHIVNTLIDGQGFHMDSPQFHLNGSEVEIDGLHLCNFIEGTYGPYYGPFSLGSTQLFMHNSVVQNVLAEHPLFESFDSYSKVEVVNSTFWGNHTGSSLFYKTFQELKFINNIVGGSDLGFAQDGAAPVGEESYNLYWQNASDFGPNTYINSKPSLDLFADPWLIGYNPLDCGSFPIPAAGSVVDEAGSPDYLEDGKPKDIGAYPVLENDSGEIVDEDGDGFDLSVDCDDGNAEVHPGAIDVVNMQDRNCDGFINGSSLGGGHVCGCATTSMTGWTGGGLLTLLMLSRRRKG